MFFRAEHCVAVLAPDGFAVRRVCGRHNVVDEHVTTVLPGADDEWLSAVSALKSRLVEWKVSGGSLSILLSHRLLRLMMVPWSDDLYDDITAKRYISAHAVDRFGSEVADWRFALTERLRPGPRLACGVAPELLSELQGVARAAGLRLTSVTPWFATVADRYRHECPTDGWLVTIEPGKLALVDLRDGDVYHVSMHSWADDAADAVRQILQRSQFRTGADSARPVAILDASGMLSLDVFATHGWMALLGARPASAGAHWFGRLTGALA